MKKISIYFLLFLSSLLISNKSYPQIGYRDYNIKELIGHYKSNDGLQFFIKKDGSFYILKRKSKALDVALPGCDTITKGTYEVFSQSQIKNCLMI